MCRMMPGSWPTPRDNHSTRSGLLSKSCTAPIHEQSHQSRTSRCSSHPSRGGKVGAAAAAKAAEAAKAVQEEVADYGCEATEVRNPSSRCQDCTCYALFRGRHRRKHRQRDSSMYLSIFPPRESGYAACGRGSQRVRGGRVRVRRWWRGRRRRRRQLRRQPARAGLR